MRQAHVEIVVRELHYPASLAETVARETGAKLVELPSMAGGVPGVNDYTSFIDYNVRTMLKAVHGKLRWTARHARGRESCEVRGGMSLERADH